MRRWEDPPVRVAIPISVLMEPAPTLCGDFAEALATFARTTSRIANRLRDLGRIELAVQQRGAPA